MRPCAPVLQLMERTPYDFTVTWRPPKPRASGSSAEAAEITHYAIDLQTSAPSGTYYPWRELWCGAGLPRPLFKKPKGSKPGEEPVFSYTLPVHPELTGRLRIRCWSAGESRPSAYSKEVTLPKVKGQHDGKEDATRQGVVKDMTTYFRGLTQHVTCGKPTWYRHGNAPSSNKWGGDAMPPPPPPSDKELKAGLVMAPVPYDVPKLPRYPQPRAVQLCCCGRVVVGGLIEGTRRLAHCRPCTT